MVGRIWGESVEIWFPGVYLEVDLLQVVLHLAVETQSAVQNAAFRYFSKPIVTDHKNSRYSTLNVKSIRNP